MNQNRQASANARLDGGVQALTQWDGRKISKKKGAFDKTDELTSYLKYSLQPQKNFESEESRTAVHRSQSHTREENSRGRGISSGSPKTKTLLVYGKEKKRRQGSQNSKRNEKQSVGFP